MKRILTPPRSAASEIMDREDNAGDDLRRALGDVRRVNRWLGGWRALRGALLPLLRETPAGGVLTLLDVGTGSADLPLAAVRLARKLGRRLHVVAVDRDGTTARLAAGHVAGCTEVAVVRADVLALPFAPRSFDVVTASLFLHHFPDERLAELLGRLARLARRAVVVNDLRRHRLAWLAILLLARLTRRHPIFVHDAPLSVLRGFTAAELLRAGHAAGAGSVDLRRRWPFRLVLTVATQAPR